MSIDPNGDTELIKLAKPINNLLVQQGNIVCTTHQGDLYRFKGLSNINTYLAGQSFKIFEDSQLFAVRANNMLLCLSK